MFGFIPGLPQVELDPQVVVVLFLPPLLYKSSFFSNFNDFRDNMRSLVMSTVALVLFAMAAVACVVHWVIPDMSWQAGSMVWDIVDFLINAILFVLIGLQLRGVIGGLADYRAAAIVGYAAPMVAVVVGSRFVWFFTVPYLVRVIDRRPEQRLRRASAGRGW